MISELIMALTEQQDRDNVSLQQAAGLLVAAKLCVQQCKEQAETITNMLYLPFEEHHGARLAYLRLNNLLGDIEQFIEENME